MNDANEFVRRWIRPEVRGLSAYHVPDPGDLIKLDAMENPYRWPAEMVEEWLGVLREVAVNRYPDPAARRVVAQLREVMGIPDEAALMLGNGSDELIQIMALSVATPQRVVMAPEPGFVMYRMIGLFTGMHYCGVPLRPEGFELDMPALREAIQRHRPALLFLAYPNNPTGNLWPEAQIRELIELTPGLVVIDEAYAPFAEASLIGLVSEYPNLVVMRTVSKLGLAGLRLGYLVGAPEWIGEFDKVRLPYNINVLTQASAEFALRHHEVFERQTAEIRDQRERVFEALSALPGLRVYPSSANFLLVRTPAGRAGTLFEQIRERGILIKNLAQSGGLLEDCLRITIGTPEENRALIEALRALL
ncbi:MAG: histidinol-phosphate transaminase [Gammaproteobacteria bacterium]